MRKNTNKNNHQHHSQHSQQQQKRKEDYKQQKEYSEILTKSTILPHLSTLDAGDVIECYALIRNAKLQSVHGSNNNSNSDGSSYLNSYPQNDYNDNGNNEYIQVRKSAIAFRYKPKSSSPDSTMKTPFELTLEYGPQRIGSMQEFEAMPNVNGHMRGLDTSSSGSSSSGNNGYVSWENHSKIYYTLSISNQDWENAYFMAPITGAVLSKILNDYVIDYPIRHPRFQPFNIIEKSTGRKIVKSSNSDDFVWNVIKALSNMYVDVQPILVPKRYSLQIYVEDKERDFENVASHNLIDVYEEKDDDENNEDDRDIQKYTTKKMNVANAASQFYQKLYSCIDSIESGDYSSFEKTDQPSAQPTFSPTSFPTAHPTVEPSVSLSAEPTVLSGSNSDRDKDIGYNNNGNDENVEMNENYDVNKDAGNDVEDINNDNSNDNDNSGGHYKGHHGKKKHKHEVKENKDDETNEDDTSNIRKYHTYDEQNDEESTNDENDTYDGNEDNERRTITSRKTRFIDEVEKEEQSNNDIESGDDYYNDDIVVIIEDDVLQDNNDEMETFVEDAENAAQEAFEAAEAAKEAAESVTDNKAAEAAEQAAEAAKKAAQATSEAAALAATENLFSGDGALMTSVISTCFSDPKYKIQYDGVIDDGSGDSRQNRIPTTTTPAFVYIDGSHYYRLNLTSPYMTVSTVVNPLPKPNIVPMGKGDFVDISLAFGIITGFIFGILVMLHHIRLLNWDSRLKFEWFFHPTKCQGDHKRLDGMTHVDSFHDDDDDDIDAEHEGDMSRVGGNFKHHMNGGGYSDHKTVELTSRGAHNGEKEYESVLT